MPTIVLAFGERTSHPILQVYAPYMYVSILSSEHNERRRGKQKQHSKQTLLNLNSVNQLIFVMVKCGVLFEVRTEFLNNI
jgi:hypothetical protein